jgi:VanZ family protein
MTKPQNRARAVLYGTLAIYWIGMFVMTSLPGRSLPSVRLSDKIIHAASFFLLGGLFLVVSMIQDRFGFLGRRPVLWALVILLIYAALDELHQEWIPGRDGSIGDWTADFVGAAAGVFLAYILFRKRLAKGGR